MTDRIKPCPFCGGEAELEKGIGIFEHSVVCQKCRCRTRIHALEEDAIKKWNTRKPMDRIVERLKIRAYETADWLCGGTMIAVGLTDVIEVVKEEQE